ncbi:UBP3-associated protein BRE5 [Nakaseomyces bracarensis]|uniref:UBP3-associated protein BRE5 n=1 Tax=Nakaseomyces bracarensis TaxID=273131 RepID=A0ABR4NSH1_9SACH
MGTPTIQEISYAFLRTYYERMNKNPSKMSNLYSNTAELTHISYQAKIDEDSDVLPTVKLTGKDNISKFFVRNEQKVNDLKVRLETCDFQTTGLNHKGILIIVTGEMFWTGTPTYRFCQTFILNPTHASSDSYDITNDIIRFISDSPIPIPTPKASNREEAKGNIGHSVKKTESLHESPLSKPEVEETKLAEATKEDQKIIAKKESVPVTNMEEKEVPKKAEVLKTEPVKEKKIEEKYLDEKRQDEKKQDEKKQDEKKQDEKKQDEKKQEDKEELKKVEEKKPQENGAEKEDSKENGTNKKSTNSSPSASTLSSQAQSKMTWASKLSQDTAVNTKAGFVKNEPIQTVKVEVSTESSPEVNGSKKNDRKLDMATRKENSSSKSKKKPVFCTVNENGFFPIYIRGTAGLKEDRLRNTLESTYGPVKKITMAENFSVVDFELQKSQTEAIETKKIVVDGIEIYMERKTIKKTPSSSSSSNASTSSTSPPGFTNVQKVYRKHSVKKKD